MNRRKIYWSDLPPELVSQIATRVATRPDILHFRAVCKEWYRSVSLPLLSDKNVLSLFLPHKLSTINSSMLKGGPSSRLEECFYEFSSDSLTLVASSILKIKPAFNNSEISPWLVTVGEFNPGKLCLKNSFSRSAVVETSYEFPKVLDMGRFEMEEMAKEYSLRFDKKPKHAFDHKFVFEEGHKLLLMVESGCKTIATINDYIAVVLYDGALSAFRLEDEVVKQLVANKVRKFDDIVMFKETVYVIDRYGKLYFIDNSSSHQLKLLNIVQTQLKSCNERRSRLVERCGELYLIRKCMVSRPSLERKSMGIRFYKLNQELMTWDELDSIGEDKILFVTPDCCFFARASNFCQGWTGNCIVLHEKRSFSTYVQSSSYDSDEDIYGDMSERKADKVEVFHFEECIFVSAQYNCNPPEWVSSATSLPKDQTWREPQRRLISKWLLQL